MNFWLALILAVIAGLIFGKAVKEKGKKFSWLAFFVAAFILLGGLHLIFGLIGITIVIVILLIKILFWPAIIIALIYLMVQLVKKSKQQKQPPAEPPTQT